MVNFVYPEEISYYVESLRPFQVKDVGSHKWLEVHEIVIKLSQQAVVEINEQREEEVKEFLISHDKIKVLIHEAYCIFLWKTRVLPLILEINPNPTATFLIYTVLFHEAAVIVLLDFSLYHVSACEVLQDKSLDLIDYCAQAVAQLIGLVSMGYHENEINVDVDEAVLSEIERQKRDLIYKIGLRSISLLNYMSCNIEALPTSAGRRMVVTHDIPWLMVDLLCFRPWQRRTKKGIQKINDSKWITVEGDEIAKINKPEAHTWFCLRQLLFNSKLMESYPLNEERCKQLAKVIGMMHQTVLDQLPPLIELKQYLTRISVCSSQGNIRKNDKGNLLLEEVPEISDALIKEVERGGGFMQVAQYQENIFLNEEHGRIIEAAMRLSNAYNIDLLADMEDNVSKSTTDEGSAGDANKCKICGTATRKKCAICRTTYYCCKECQTMDWAKHKLNCGKDDTF